MSTKYAWSSNEVSKYRHEILIYVSSRRSSDLDNSYLYTVVSVFIFPNIISGRFSFFAVTDKSWLLIGWGKLLGVLIGFLAVIHLGVPLQ